MKLFTIGRYTFAPQLKWALLAIIVAYLFSSLGFWQLRRADEKQLMLNHHQHMQHAQPMAVTAQSLLLIKQDQPIEIKGVYDAEHLFLLDNQFYQHQIGYEVIEPLIIGHSDRVILVSRGWVKAPVNRKKLPTIFTPTGSQKIHGVAHFPPKSLFLLGNNVDVTIKESWPKRVEQIQIRSIKKWLGHPVYPFILRLDPDEPNGFIRDWPVVTMSPERHVGYAVQWFAMALTVIIIFIILSFKK